MSDEQARTDAEIVAEARERFRLASDAESMNRTEALTDVKFRHGDQWPVDVSRERATDGRPCLTINITDAVVRRVVNACRENRPRIKVHPVGEGATVEVAKILDGLIRHIEEQSGADYAYDLAVENAITGGWGYIGIGSDYIDESSFEQELKLEAVRNPFTEYHDPADTSPDGSGAEWHISSVMIRREDYKRKYGHIDGAWNYIGAGDQISDWATKEEIRIAHYWRVERVEDTLCKLSDGRDMFRSELPSKMGMEHAGLSIVTQRPSVRRKVVCYLISPSKVLQKQEWAGRYIPKGVVYGRDTDINGKRHLKGMVRDLRDPARMYNYSETARTEMYGLQPKAPWIGPAGFMEGKEAAWRDANRRPLAALEYKPVTGPNGETLPPPQRAEPPPVAAGFVEWSQSSQSNFMAVAGMPHEPNQDAKGEVVSGIAIKRREGLADVSHFDFYDNLTRTLRHLGRMLIELIPYYYDTQRVQRIINPDGTPQTVTINEKVIEDGIERIRNDLTVGRYDVVIDTGPSYATKREESAEAKLELLGTPLGEMVGKSAGDLIVRGMDFENSDEIADRLQALIPGAAQTAMKDLPQKAQAIIAALQGQLKELGQKNMALELEIHAKHGLEQIRQKGETERKQMDVDVRREDTITKAHTAVHDTHVKAVTAHDVAEIQAAATLMNTNVEAEHNKAAAKELLKHADKAEKRAE